jgi:hypothetical protein
MPTLISNCSDTNGLAGAFSKVQKYADDQNFKIQKSKDDILKLMAACTAQKPPDRPEVKFEDVGKTITATVGKNKKTMLVVATKMQTADISKLTDDIKKIIIGSREGATGGVAVLLEQEKKLGNNPPALRAYWNTSIPQVGDQIKDFEKGIQEARKKLESTETLIKLAPPQGWERIVAEANKVIDDAVKVRQKADDDLKKIHQRFLKLPK